jgi:hypothetical protein
MFPLGRSSRGTMPLATGSLRFRKDDRDRRGLALGRSGHRGRDCQDDVGLQADQLVRKRSYPIDVRAGPPKVYPHTLGPSVQPKPASD